MSRKQLFTIIISTLALGVLFIPTPGVTPSPPVNSSTVDKAFDEYKRLWIKHNLAAADKLDSGELKTDSEANAFIASGQEPARRIAFDEIAKSEQEYFKSNGGWTPELHSKLLRSYSK